MLKILKGNARVNIEIFFGVLIVAAIVIWAAAFSQPKADSGNLKVYFFDVGQGDSEYIKTPGGGDILIDGGPDDSVLADLGKVMSPGDRKIDLVILTHPHADHLTGLIEVIKRYEVGEIWETGVEYPSSAYDTWKSEIKNLNITDKFVKAGEEKDFDNLQIKFKILSPLSPFQNRKIDNINNASIVNRLEDGSFSVLFMGDAEKEVQLQIKQSLSKATVLKVGHHGSENGTAEDMLKIVRPAIAVIEVGRGNTYGHPAKSVIEMLKNYAATIYRTDQNGTVEVDYDGTDYKVKTSK